MPHFTQERKSYLELFVLNNTDYDTLAEFSLQVWYEWRQSLQCNMLYDDEILEVRREQ